MSTTGSYKIDYVELIDQPTVGRWVPREIVGIDGTGHPVYPATREFEMSWNLISPACYNQIYLMFRNASGTAYITAELPIYGGSAFNFRLYSGCTIQDITFGDEYFTDDGYIPNVRLTLMNITGIP